MRRFYYNHNLKELAKALQGYFQEENLHPQLFDEDTQKIIEDLQSYNSQTHRYLAHDKTELGADFRALHEVICNGRMADPKSSKNFVKKGLIPI